MARMTKKKGKTVKKKTKKPHKDLHHLTMIFKYTERNIKGDGSDMDTLFIEQAARIWKRIEELK